MSTDRDKIFGYIQKGTPMWCLHCDRAYPHGNYRTLSIAGGEQFLQMCPYEDCDGDAVLDSQEWESIREDHPDYPQQPVYGIVYRM